MTTPEIIRLILQLLVLLAWIAMVVSLIGTLRKRAEAEGTTAMAQFPGWMKSDEDRSDRKTLIFLTFVLVAMNVMNIVMG